MHDIRAIFFDIGDTLVYDDPPLIERVRQSLDACRLPYRQEDLEGAYRSAENYAMSQYLKGVPFDHPDVLAASSVIILRELGIGALDREQVMLLRQTYLECGFRRVLHDGALALLCELGQRGFRLGAISDWEPTLPDLLSELGVAGHFQALAVSAIVGVTKPNPGLFNVALEQMNANGGLLTANQAIHIGDYFELDVAGARAAGMHPILFDWKMRKLDADCERVVTFEQLSERLLALPSPAN